MEPPITSEEKLLKLIRKPSPAKEFKKETEKNNKTRVDFLAFSNKLLLIVFIVLFAYVMADIFYFQKQKHESENAGSVLGNPKKIETPADILEEKPFSFYQGEFERRNVFQYPWEKPDPNQPGQEGASGQIVDLTSQIKISGILMGGSPQVIVEDMKTHQTFFLSPGESVVNAKVEEIKADRVIFNYNGNKVEMIP